MFAIVPAIASLFAFRLNGSAFAVLLHAAVFAGFYAALLLLTHSRFARIARVPFLAVVCIHYVAVTFLILYVLAVGNLFDPVLLIDYRWEVFHGLARILGGIRFLALIGGLLLVLAFVAWSWRRLYRHEERKGMRLPRLLSLTLALLAVAGLSQMERAWRLCIQDIGTQRGGVIAAPRETFAPPEGNDSVFIVQLESTNSFALMGQMSRDGKRYDGMYMPVLRRIASDGLFFPFFFSNQQQTIRAMEAILCGIPANTGKNLAEWTEGFPFPCLPDILGRSGYETYYFSGFDNPRFANMGSFAGATGFDEVHFGDILRKDDPKETWGYDDCTYYTRVFDYLRDHSTPDAKKFVYVQVSSHHANFYPQARYAAVDAFPNPANELERYIDSMLEQDRCLTDFYDAYAAYAPDTSHLFILGDHPWGLRPWARYEGKTETFLTPLAYVPPRSQAQDFGTDETVTELFSHADLFPTILQLLDGNNRPNSFVFRLRKDTTPTNYEQCQILHSLYDGGTTAVVRGNFKFTYVHPTRSLYAADIDLDLPEDRWNLVEKNLPFDTFVQQYFCDRYSVYRHHP